jgi:glycosyltransferase family protein
MSYLYQYIKLKSTAEDLFKGIKIISENETLDEIILNNKSISRFGDGEFYLIYGNGNYFQEYNKNLCKKLKFILKCNEDGLLIGLNIPYKNNQLDRYIDNVKKYYNNYINNFKYKIYRLLNKQKKYYSSTITRFYIDYKDKTGVPNYINKLKKIWDKRDIIIIEGEKSRLGIGNDLFKNVKSIKRILCPFQNAFNVYKKIIRKVVTNIEKNNLILLALGPTATVLAFDLYKLGYQVIDVGHIDIEYEWFLKKTTIKVQIDNKYVAEVNGANYNFTKVKDKNYSKQIMAKILK